MSQTFFFVFKSRRGVDKNREGPDRPWIVYQNYNTMEPHIRRSGRPQGPDWSWQFFVLISKSLDLSEGQTLGRVSIHSEIDRGIIDFWITARLRDLKLGNQEKSVCCALSSQTNLDMTDRSQGLFWSKTTSYQLVRRYNIFHDNSHPVWRMS